MNNRQISEQAGVDQDVYTWNQIQLERFAELVRQDEQEKCAADYLDDCARAVKKAEEEERKECAKQYLKIARDAVKGAILKEREACAKLCDEARAARLAELIRGRTE